MGRKICRACKIEKGLEDFYPDPSYPGGFKASCRECHNKRTVEARKRRKLREKYQAPPISQLSIENNLQAIQRMAAYYEKVKPESVSARVKLNGALFPIENGATIRPGKVGPVLQYQTSNKPVLKSLAIEPLFHIATEMSDLGVEICWDSLPLPDGLDSPSQKVDNNSKVSEGES